MDIEILSELAGKLSSEGYDDGFISARTEKGIIITPNAKFYTVAAQDVLIVNKERNVDKEKAVHLTAYEKCAGIKFIAHVYPQYSLKLAAAGRGIYPYSKADARITGALIRVSVPNVLQIADALSASGVALTPSGLFVAADTSSGIINAVKAVERAAKIEYLINSHSIEAGDNNTVKSSDISVKTKIFKPKKLGFFEAIGERRKNSAGSDFVDANGFYGGCGFIARLDNGVLCALNAAGGGEVILNKASAKSPMFKMFLELYDDGFDGAVAVANGEAAIIAAGRNDDDFCRVRKLNKSGRKEAVTNIKECGYCLIEGYGVAVSGESTDKAFKNAEIKEREFNDYLDLLN